MHYAQPMRETEALTILSALAQSTRLKVVTLLGRLGDAGMASSDIADEVGVPRHLMSAHLAILGRAGVVKTHKAGRTVTYSVCRNVVQELSSYLTVLTRSSELSE